MSRTRKNSSQTPENQVSKHEEIRLASLQIEKKAFELQLKTAGLGEEQLKIQQQLNEFREGLTKDMIEASSEFEAKTQAMEEAYQTRAQELREKEAVGHYSS